MIVALTPCCGGQHLDGVKGGAKESHGGGVDGLGGVGFAGSMASCVRSNYSASDQASLVSIELA
jgi:hypothetical protein